MFESFSRLAKRVFGDANERELKKLQPMVAAINALEPQFEALSDEQIAAKTIEFRTRIDNGAPLDDLLVEAFAVVREASKRTLGMRPYDCQLIGGTVIHQGKIAEMKTGEGKTLVATLPVYLNALSGKGTHVVTVNDYLADRDADWMAEVYNFLGMSVGKVLSGERNQTIKRDAYAADITYGTNNEFGFDYLRDNMKFRIEDMVQRGHNFGIVDEIDSILIDEARTPLIISGPAAADVDLYRVVDQVIPLLQEEVDFTVDEKARSAVLTDAGVHKVEARLGIDNLFDPNNMEVLHHVQQCLKAHHTFKRDKDYVVQAGEVVIVDDNTGRLMAGRRWSDGLHQAIEAKEKVRIQEESQTYATITYQNLFRMYDKLAGMTGTAATEAAEFASIYDLDTMIIPTNKPIARIDSEDIVYKTQMEKFRAVMTDIEQANAKGQPVLVGTTSVEKSEIVSKLLKRAGIAHEILNAKNHSREAHIVSQAGRLNAVTISTNMAGRGTDIKLGGSPEAMAEDVASIETDPDGFAVAFAKFEPECAAEKAAVLAAGGLHIVGTERHDSRRVDNQLRGRSGRQGDPGSSRFFLSLEDELMRLFGGDKVTVWMERMGLKDDEPIEHRWISKAIENAQKKVEGRNFQMRKNLLEYDDVMNYQRQGVYELRRRALDGEDMMSMVDESIVATAVDTLDDSCGASPNPEAWDLTILRKRLKDIANVEWADTDEQLRDASRTDLEARFKDELRKKVEGRAEALGKEAFNSLARMFVLQFSDQFWKDHLLAVDRLRQGVSLRGYGQRNPLLEYKREAYHMYLLMEAMRDEEVLKNLMGADDAAAATPPGNRPSARPSAGAPAARPAPAGGASDPLAAVGLPPMPGITSPGRPAAPAAAAPPRVPTKGDEARAFGIENAFGKNDPCPCQSGQKFKKCCGKGASAAPAPAPLA
ncbi:MAG: preprotein translocase subunit SecA [Myxococcota bacterium]|jgi:preprotein translocase subunit SecA